MTKRLAFLNEARRFYISHGFHICRTSISPHFHKLTLSNKQEVKKYVFRNGMVLVAAHCYCHSSVYPFQDKVYEMVEQTSAGAKK